MYDCICYKRFRLERRVIALIIPHAKFSGRATWSSEETARVRRRRLFMHRFSLFLCEFLMAWRLYRRPSARAAYRVRLGGNANLLQSPSRSGEKRYIFNDALQRVCVCSHANYDADAL